MSLGVLAFQYGSEKSSSGLTANSGLGVYLDLIKASGLGPAIRRHVKAAGPQGWLDIQMIVALLALNLCGGDRVSDLERLAADPGLAMTISQLEKALLSRRERQLPSASSLLAWLERFDDPAQEDHRVASKAFIPKATAGLCGLERVNRALLAFIQRQAPQAVATLEMDATLVESHKRSASRRPSWSWAMPISCPSRARSLPARVATSSSAW